jgi:hypothetical protein
MNVFLHDFDVDFIIEMNHIPLIVPVDCNMKVDVMEISDMSIEISVLIDDVIECDLQFRLNLAHVVNGAHHKLIKMSVNQELRFSTKLNLHDCPYLFKYILRKLQSLTQFKDSL